MAGFRELARLRTKDTTEDGTTAQRGFVQDDAGVDTLPAIGDEHPDRPDLTARRIRESQFGDLDDTILSTVSYEAVQSEPFDNERSPEDLQTGISIGNVAFPVLPNSENVAKIKWKWLNAKDAGGNQLIIQQALNKIEATMRLSMERIVHKLEVETWMRKVGKINFEHKNRKLYNMPRGTVLFTGLTARDFRNSNGVRRWRINYEFLIRQVNFDDGDPDVGLAAGEGGRDGWNWVFNSLSGEYDRPFIENANFPFLYRSANFFSQADDGAGGAGDTTTDKDETLEGIF